MKLELKKINKKFEDWGISDFTIKIDSGSFVSLVGPSGSGKTTLLRIISGLEIPDSGIILFDEKNITSFEPEKRNVGFVFQNEALFSHLNVFENVAFGLKMKKEKNIEKKVATALSLVHLNGFDKRNVTRLSGGEKRRVAIARAIAYNPKILLLDEPLNGLDAPLKEKMKFLLKELQEKTGITAIMVTHDIDDAFFLSDKIAVMICGKIEQFDNPIKIFKKPKNKSVKDFISDYALSETKIKGKKVFVSSKKSNYRFQ